MSADFLSPTTSQSKVSQLTNLFSSSSIRRSRSLVSLQKQAEDDTRSQSSLGLSNDISVRRPALKSNKSSIEGDGRTNGKKWIITPILPSATFPSSTSSNYGYRTPSPPSRPKPAPSLWDDEERADFDRKGSLHGLETTVAPRTGSPYSLSSSSFVSAPYTLSPRAQSPLARGSPRSMSKESSVSRRRKPSVADLEPMTTVQESNQDSPTIPHHHSRNASLEAIGRYPSSRESLTPRAVNNPKLEGLKTPTMTHNHKSYRRSSMLLPDYLAPLVIPNSLKAVQNPSTMFLPSTAYTGKSPVELVAPYEFMSLEETPPKVPPKSPRYLERAANNKSTAVSTPNLAKRSPRHTPNSSVSTISEAPESLTSTEIHTANSSVTSFSPGDALSGSKGVLPQTGGGSPIKTAKTTSPLLWPTTFNDRQASPRRPLHSQNNFSIDDTISRPVLVKAASSVNLHQRNVSDSVLNRGRPVRRQRSFNRGIKLATINGILDQLPEGHRTTSVLGSIPTSELRSLRTDAEYQASSFHTLAEKDVEDLTRELTQLDSHCSELHHNVIQLRENRKQLHSSMLSFLRAPGNALVNREHVVTKASALSKLDLSVDEWTTKLEAAQERRIKVQRKLHEHLSAVLTLRLPGTIRGSHSEEQTPPRSPDDVINAVASGVPGQLERVQSAYAWQQAAMQEQMQEQQTREEESRAETQRQIEAMEKEQEAMDQAQQQREKRERHQTNATSAEVMFVIEEAQLIEGRRGTPLQSERGGEPQSPGLYDDSGVASLLASIEKEIDAMDMGRN